MFQRCELAFSVANIAILRKPENVARIFQGSFIKKVCNLAEINNNNIIIWNAAEHTDVAVLLMS